MPNLERLVLEGCKSLVVFDPFVGDLSNISLMNLKDCRRLNSLPNSICKLKSLKTLILIGCSRLQQLPDELKELQSLVNLNANGTSISKNNVHSSFVLFKHVISVKSMIFKLNLNPTSLSF